MTTTTTTTTAAPTNSPWGAVQTAREICPGAWDVSTEGHGGIKLDRRLNAKMPPCARSDGGWYEEDCEWSLPIMCLPEVAQGLRPDGMAELIESARISCRNWFPQVYCELTGESLESLRGRSYIYDQECFLAENANKYVAITAWGDWHETVPYRDSSAMMAAKWKERSQAIVDRLPGSLRGKLED